MSIISEGIAADNAKRLEKIILDAMYGPWGDVRSAVRGFVKVNLVPWYYVECEETYGAIVPHTEIVKAFPKIENKLLRPEDCVGCDKANTEYCKKYCINVISNGSLC